MNDLFLNRNIIQISDAKQMNVLELAFVGDSVFELYVKNKLVQKNDKVKNLTINANKIVNAGAQEKAFFRIKDNLTDEEMDFVMRGRNAHINTKAKNFSIETYRHATALESLVGYLYLTGQDDRLSKLFIKMDLFGDSI